MLSYFKEKVMNQDKTSAEYVLGKDYKEKVLKNYMREFLNDDETQALFEELCFELGDSCLSDIELLEKIKILPYNMAYSVIHNIRGRDAETLMGLLRDSYYDEFIQAVDCVDDNGENAFEFRYLRFRANILKKLSSKFLDKRVLTREELQVLITAIETKTCEKLGLEKHDHEFYKGDNKYCIELVKAHSIMVRVDVANVRRKIIENNKKHYLRKIIQEIKQNNKVL